MSLRYSILTVILAFVAVTACSPGEARTAAEHGIAGGRVAVRRETTVLAEFSHARVAAVVDGGHLSIELVSPDGAHRLVIEVDGTGPGQYRLVPTFEPGAATLLLVSRGLPSRISPAQGELVLTDVRHGRYSGAFAGQATDHGFTYRFEGAFELVPVRRL